MTWPTGVPKNMTAAERVERARRAALARTTADHHIAALAKLALTTEQRLRLAALLVGQPGDEVAAS